MSHPQSGVLSAVGLMQEATWGQPPLGTPAGSLYPLGTTTNPLRYCAVEPNGGIVLKPTLNYPHEIDTGVEIGRRTFTKKEYQGGFSQRLDPEGGWYPLYLMLGQDAQHTTQASTTTQNPAVYTHRLRPYKSADSASVVEAIVDFSVGRLSSGFIMRTLKISFPQDDVRLQWDGYAKSQVPNTYNASTSPYLPVDYDYTNSGTDLIPAIMGGDGTKEWQVPQAPSLVDIKGYDGGGQFGNGPFAFGAAQPGTVHAAAYVQIAGNNGSLSDIANVEILPGMEINIERMLQWDQVLGSGLECGAATGSKIVVSGRMQMILLDNKIAKAAAAGARLALNFMLIGPPIGTSTIPYSAEFYIPNLQLTENAMQLPDGRVIVGGSFGAIKDPTLGYGIEILLTNTFSTTGMSASTGGIGGGSLTTY